MVDPRHARRPREVGGARDRGAPGRLARARAPRRAPCRSTASAWCGARSCCATARWPWAATRAASCAGASAAACARGRGWARGRCSRWRSTATGCSPARARTGSSTAWARAATPPCSRARASATSGGSPRPRPAPGTPPPGRRAASCVLDGRGVRVVADTDESNLVSLLADGRGGVFAGGDSKGRVLHARRDGSVRTVFDAGEDEIRALALGRDGALYAAALSSPGSREDDKDGEPKPAATRARRRTQRALPDRARLLGDLVVGLAPAAWSSPSPRAAGAPGPAAGGILAATGNRAALYRVERAGGATQLLAVPQGQVTALAALPGGALAAATSNPATLWLVGPGQAERGELLSMPLDARRIARFGRVLWQGEGRGQPRRARHAQRQHGRARHDLEPVGRRSRGDGAGGAIASPPARYLQWRLGPVGRAGEHRLGRDVVARAEPAAAGGGRAGGAAGAGLPRGRAAAAPRAGHAVPAGRAARRVQRAVGHDAATDARPAASGRAGCAPCSGGRAIPTATPCASACRCATSRRADWIELAKDLEQPNWTWDTSALPDGRYRLRVTAGDEAGNAVGEETTRGGREPALHRGQHAPRLGEFGAGRGERAGVLAVHGAAADAGSPLQRIEVSVDDGPWRAVTPGRRLHGRPVALVPRRARRGWSPAGTR